MGKHFEEIESLNDLVNQLIEKIRDNWEHIGYSGSEYDKHAMRECEFDDVIAREIGLEAVEICKIFFNTAMADILGAQK